MLEDDDHGEIDELEARAIRAWCSIDPATGRDAPPLEGGIAAGFVDRVMRAEAQSQVFTRVVTLDESEARAPAAANPHPWRSVPLAACVGAAALALTTVSVVLLPADEDEIEVAAPPISRNINAGYTRPEQLGAPPLSSSGTPGRPIPADLEHRIESYLSGYGSNWGPAFEFHGVVLVARQGQVRYARGFGTADPAKGRRNLPTTRFRLGLLTEPFTATAILQLRDTGLIDLDDTVSKFVPDYPDGDRIKVEHLLTHTAGIPNYTQSPKFQTWKNEAHTTEQMLRRLEGEGLEFEPGTDFSPTNSGYYLLGAIIERVTGLDYGQYVGDFIFNPAGMHASTFGDVYETGEQARGHVWNDEEILDPPDPIHMSVFGGAGGLVSTALDLVRFDAALREGKLLSPHSVEDMLRPQESGYGYGWIVSEAFGQRLVSFPGAIDGFNGSMMRFVGDATLVVVLCNTEVVSGTDVANDVARMVYGEDVPPRVEHRAIEIAPGTYPKYLGTYGVTEQTRRAYAHMVSSESFAQLEQVIVRQLDDRLYFDVPGHAMTWMHPMGQNRFFFKDHAGSTLSFALGEDGRATTLTLHFQEAPFELRRLD